MHTIWVSWFSQKIHIVVRSSESDGTEITFSCFRQFDNDQGISATLYLISYTLSNIR